MKSTIHLIKAKLQLQPVADLELMKTYGGYMVMSIKDICFNTEGLN